MTFRATPQGSPVCLLCALADFPTTWSSCKLRPREQGCGTLRGPGSARVCTASSSAARPQCPTVEVALTKLKDTPAGFLAITLHAHLPYVVHHGTWPHGIEWLHEAAAETYLPLLRMLETLERDGIPANLNINISPVLLEQLAHPHFISDFPKYLNRKIIAAREDEAY